MNVRAIIIPFMAALSLTAQAHADDVKNKEICLYYGNVGAAAVDFLLPLKLQQVVDMIGGRDNALLQKMTKNVEGVGNAGVRSAIKELGDDAAEHLGASAGFLAFQLIMTGQATTPQEVFSVLYRSCSDTGPIHIVDNQRKSREDLPEPPPQ